MSRLIRMLASFVMLWSAYWLYSLVVVPLVEPRAVARPQPAATSVPTNDSQLSAQVERLRPYFPAGAPELQNPIVLESPGFSLLLKDYRVVADRQVQIKPCTMVFFPDGQTAPPGSRPRAIILQALAGAVLDFDEQCDLSRMKIGRLLGGRMVGDVTIRGNLARGADPNDPAGELEVLAHDVQLNQERIWSPHDVQFRLGASRGSGSDMQILLARPTAGQRGSHHTMPRGIEAFQLMRDVRLLADFGGRGLQPLPTEPPAGRAASHVAAGPQPPIEIRCEGPFRFDLIDYVATFEDRVNVVRMNPVGESDQMTCELLALYFTRDLKLPAAAKADAGAPLQIIANHDRPGQGRVDDKIDIRKTGPLAISRIEARGHPVVVRAPSATADARGEHLEYHVQTGALLLEGDQPVTLHHGPQEITARLVRYTPAPGGEMAEMLADGAGQLSATLPSDPSRRLQASWSKQLSLRPHEGKQLISVLGDARIAYGEFGSLTGGEIWLWLLPSPPEAAGGPPDRAVAHGDQHMPGVDQGGLGRTAGRLQPHSLLARGDVRIDSPQLGGHTDQLEVWFQSSANEAPQQRGAAAAPQPAGGKPAPGPTTSAASQPASQYEFNGRLTRLQLTLQGQQVVLRDAAISGDVALVEQPPPGSVEKPMRLSGDELQLLSADTSATTLTVSGKPALVSARGLALSGANIQLDKSANRLWIDGTGETALPLSSESGGRAGAAPQSMAVRFVHGFSFDGRTATFDGQVIAYTDRQRLDTAHMTVRLVDAIDFSRPKQRDRPQVQQIACTGGVLLENRSLEEGRVTAIDHVQTADLTIDQQSGDLQATGPGWVSTVREQKSASPMLPGARLASAAAPRSEATGLSYLKIRFQEAITGNLHRREMTFADQVTCVYGPVAQWTDEIDTFRAADLTAQQVLLTCDRLTANDLGSANSGASDSAGHSASTGGLLGGGSRAIELQATGNARVDGQTFTAQGDRLTYAAEKQLLVLEGAGLADAHLWLQRAAGEPRSHAAARKILYWRATNRVELDGTRFLDLNQLGRTP